MVKKKWDKNYSYFLVLIYFSKDDRKGLYFEKKTNFVDIILVVISEWAVSDKKVKF